MHLCSRFVKGPSFLSSINSSFACAYVYVHVRLWYFGSEHCVQIGRIIASVYSDLQLKSDLTLQIETNPKHTYTHTPEGTLV